MVIKRLISTNFDVLSDFDPTLAFITILNAIISTFFKLLSHKPLGSELYNYFTFTKKPKIDIKISC